MIIKGKRKPNLTLAADEDEVDEKAFEEPTVFPSTTTFKSRKLALADEKPGMFQKHGLNLSDSIQSTPKSIVPTALIEGPEPSQDLSYKWVLKVKEVQMLE